MPYRTRTLALAGLALLVTLTACGPSSLKPLTFDAAYSPMGSIGDFRSAPECAAFKDLVVKDGRQGDTIGIRYLEEGQERFDVSLGGDVEAWLQSAAENALDKADIDASGDSDRTVHVTLNRIETDESVYRRAEYDAKVIVDAAVSGGATWSKTVDGFSENYGYAGSAENYQETLNHAADRALAAMVNDDDFLAALCPEEIRP